MADPRTPRVRNFFCALASLQVYASLRYSYTPHVSEVFITETAFRSTSVGPKSTNADVMQWATPLGGYLLLTGMAQFWSGGKQFGLMWRDRRTPYSPYWGGNCEIPTEQKSKQVSVQAALPKLEKEFNGIIGIRIHSPMSLVATLAKQLLYSRGDREKLGHCPLEA